MNFSDSLMAQIFKLTLNFLTCMVSLVSAILEYLQKPVN